MMSSNRAPNVNVVRKVAIFYGHAASNIGDLAINAGQVRLLRAAFPQASITVVLFNVERSAFLREAKSSFLTEDRIDFRFFKSHSSFALSYSVEPANFLVDCGVEDADLIALASGELLFEYAGSDNAASIYWRILPVLAARASGKASVVLPSTFGPFETSISRNLFKSMANIADLLAVREARSAEMVKHYLGLSAAPPVHLDPAFFLSSGSDSEQPSEGRRERAGLSVRLESWGIRLRSGSGLNPKALTVADVRSSQAYAFSRAFASGWLENPRNSLTIFAQTAADDLLARTLVDDLGGGTRVVFISPGSVQEYVHQLGKLDFVVTSRFHAAILSLVSKTLPIGVYFSVHGHKMPGLFESLGIPQYCFQLDGADLQVAASSVAVAVQGTGVLEEVYHRIQLGREATVEWLRSLKTTPCESDGLVSAFGDFGRVAKKIGEDGLHAAAAKEIAEKEALSSKKLSDLHTRLDELQIESGRAVLLEEQANEFRQQLNEAISAKAMVVAQEKVLMERLEGLAKSLDAAHRVNEKQTERAGVLRKKLDRSNELLAEEQQNLIKEREKARNAVADLERLSARHEALQSEALAAQDAVSMGLQEREDLRGRVTASAAEVAALHSRVTDLLASLDDCKRQLTMAASDARQKEIRVAELEIDIQDLQLAGEKEREEMYRRADESAAECRRFQDLAVTYQNSLDESQQQLKTTLLEVDANRARIAHLSQELQHLQRTSQEAKEEMGRRTNAYASEIRRSRDLVSACENSLAESRRQLKIALLEADAGRTQILNLSNEMRELQRVADHALAESKGMKLVVASELSRARELAMSEIEEERRNWSGLLAYRAGHVLVEGIANKRAWPGLPLRLYREWKSYQNDRKRREMLGISAPLGPRDLADIERRVAIRLASPLTLELVSQPRLGVAQSVNAKQAMTRQVVDSARPDDQERVEGIVRGLQQANPSISSKHLAMELLQCSKELRATGDSALDVAIAQAAYELDGSHGVLRGVFWLAQGAADYELASKAIQKIEALHARVEPTMKEVESLAQLKRSPSYQLSLLREEAKRPEVELVPVRRRICYVLHNSLPISSGGYATRSHGLAKGLVANGYEVICVTRPGFPWDVKEELAPEAVAKEEMIDGVRYMRVPEPVSKGGSVVDYVNNAADVLEGLFAELKPELVLAASNHRIGLMAWKACARLGLPFIYEVRGWWELTRMSRDPDFVNTPTYAIQKRLEYAVANLADHVFTLTGPMKRELMAQGLPESKVTLLRNSCDPDDFRRVDKNAALAMELAIPEGVPVIGYIGTFVDYEGLEDLTAACGLLKQSNMEFRLLLVGNENTSGSDRGPITGMIQEAAAKYGLEDWLIMPGRVPHDRVVDYYSLVDIAPFPRKPWPVCEMVSPMKPLEAMAMEKAVVASDVEALTEMIEDGVTGLLFRKGDIDSLSEKLRELAQSPELRMQLGAAARCWVEKDRTWKATAALAGDIVRNVVDDASITGRSSAKE